MGIKDAPVEVYSVNYTIERNSRRNRNLKPLMINVQ